MCRALGAEGVLCGTMVDHHAALEAVLDSETFGDDDDEVEDEQQESPEVATPEEEAEALIMSARVRAGWVTQEELDALAAEKAAAEAAVPASVRWPKRKRRS